VCVFGPHDAIPPVGGVPPDIPGDIGGRTMIGGVLGVVGIVGEAVPSIPPAVPPVPVPPVVPLVGPQQQGPLVPPGIKTTSTIPFAPLRAI